LSSGKLTRYLSCGIPVIASNNLYGYKDYIDGNNIGKVCNNAQEILDSIKLIEENYEIIKGNVRNFYINKIEFKNQFDNVVEEINRVIRNNKKVKNEG
jgi:glycosyltransferase involved in cell wall biosynthesis